MSKGLQKKMYVVIDDESYYITNGLRWITDSKQLINALSVGNVAEIEYIVQDKYKSFVSIKIDNEYFVTKEETLVGQEKYTRIISTCTFYVAYLYFLIVIIFIVEMNDKYLLDTTYGYNHKVYLSYSQIILNIIISNCLFIGSFLIIVLNKWLYFSLITLAIGYILWSFISVNKILYEKNGLKVYKYLKHKQYSWNVVKEIVMINKRFKTIVIINFKKSYNLLNYTFNLYKKTSKYNKNNHFYLVKLNKQKKKEFDMLYKKYYFKNKGRFDMSTEVLIEKYESLKYSMRIICFISFDNFYNRCRHFDFRQKDNNLQEVESTVKSVYYDEEFISSYIYRNDITKLDKVIDLKK